MKEVFTDMDSKDIKSEYLNGVYSEISDLLGIEAAVTRHKVRVQRKMGQKNRQ